MPSIESHDFTLGDIFKDFYAVPDYQREYVWQEDEVEQLLADIRAEQLENPSAEYFIGSIVTCPGKNGRLDLIDGQQRMTTLFVALCALRDRLQSLGDTQNAAIQNLIANQKVDEAGQESFEARLELQYEDAGDVLESFVRGGQRFDDRKQTRSIGNILKANRTAIAFYEREFGADTKGLRSFFGYLVNRVKLIRVKTDGLARALKIFETINDRGVGLDAMDLLKNLLFMKTKQSDFERLKARWKDLVDGLHKSREKPMRFLRYFVLAKYGEEKLREDDLYNWLVTNAEKVGIIRSPIAFVAELNDACNAYGHFLKGHGPDGQRHQDVESLQLLAGKATRQHLILLLAARRLPEPVFSAVCRDAENILFVYLITRQINREFETFFPAWAVELAQVADLDGYELFAERTFRKRRRELADRFRREFEAINMAQLKAFQCRYVVAKLTQSVDLAGFGQTSEGHKWLSRYCDGSAYHVEHISPQTPSDESRTEFGPDADDEGIVWSIGNLALAEAAINHSLGNKPYTAKDAAMYRALRPLKSEVYPQSQLLLTRAISAQVTVGKNTAIDRAVSEFAPFAAWDARSVKLRAAMLTKLAARVWDVE